MSWRARLLFGLLLLTSIVVPVQWPHLAGLAPDSGWWGAVLTGPMVFVMWIGAEFDIKRRKAEMEK